jgi:hypothetical protein
MKILMSIPEDDKRQRKINKQIKINKGKKQNKKVLLAPPLSKR